MNEKIKFPKRKFEALKNLIQKQKVYFADIVFSFYGRDFDKVPYPVYKFLLQFGGSYAGVSIQMVIHQYQQEIKKIRRRYVVASYGVPIIIFIGIVLLAVDDKINFWGGFVENLAADIVLLLLTIYFLPKVLNKPKNYSVALVHRNVSQLGSVGKESKQEIIISIINTGKEVYKSGEIFWEIFIDSGIQKEDFTLLSGEFDNDGFFSNMLRFYGSNQKPLFLDDTRDIVKIKIKKELLCSKFDGPYRIYFRFKTINGNIPDLEGVTKEFLGMGVPIEQYPKVADYYFDDYYDPDYRSNKENSTL